jgi:hypothetical protein
MQRQRLQSPAEPAGDGAVGRRAQMNFTENRHGMDRSSRYPAAIAVKGGGVSPTLAACTTCRQVSTASCNERA